VPRAGKAAFPRARADLCADFEQDFVIGPATRALALFIAAPTAYD
jgi:hypothetical protein